MLTRFFHIALACLLLVGSTGIVVNRHFCQQELKDVAFFAQPESCHSKQASTQKACPLHPVKKGCSKEEEKGCCENTSDFFQVEDDWQTTLSGKQASPQTPVPLLPPYTLVPIWVSAATNAVHYLNYKPPLITLDFPSLILVFRL